MAKTLGKTLAKLYKSYLFTVVVQDMKKLADIDYKKQFKKATKAAKNIEFDKKYWLHKAGLTTYTPVKSTLGSGILFVIGAAVGAIAGMALAPSTGAEFRKTIKAKAGPMFSQDVGQTQAPAEA